ncbi:MAG: hypothetical protein Q9195_007937 [Heterodermia aff. obscurata]
MVEPSKASGDIPYGFAPLAPKPQESQDTLQGLGPSTIPLGKVARKAKTSTKSAEEWDAKKMVIHYLYIIQDLSLPEVIKIMENENSFSQSYAVPLRACALQTLRTYNCRRRKQYTTKLKEWGYDKNIKETDMRAIAHKDLKRKAEDPLRPSTFRLRGKPVPNSKIERYEKDKGFLNDGFDPLAATPSAISCNTLWAYAASAIINSRKESATSTLEGSLGYPSAFKVNRKVVRLDFALGGPILEVNISNDHSASSTTEFYAYNPGDLWRMMHNYVMQCAQSPVRGYSTPELKLRWNFQNELVTEGTIKLELPHNFLAPTNDVDMEDLQNEDRTEPRAHVETPFEAQFHRQQDCRCSLCCLTLTNDVPADPDMESFKELSLESRDWSIDHHKVGLVDPRCPLYCLAIASDALADLDTESLLTLSSGTPGWIKLYADRDFGLVWSLVDDPENGNVISLPTARLSVPATPQP